MKMTGANQFEQYSAYAYDTVLSIAIMLNKTIMELKANGITGGLDNFDYHNKQLRERFQKVLNQVEFDGLIVSGTDSLLFYSNNVLLVS